MPAATNVDAVEESWTWTRKNRGVIPPGEVAGLKAPVGYQFYGLGLAANCKAGQRCYGEYQGG